jgi:hypothetical protein
MTDGQADRLQAVARTGERQAGVRIAEEPEPGERIAEEPEPGERIAEEPGCIAGGREAGVRRSGDTIGQPGDVPERHQEPGDSSTRSPRYPERRSSSEDCEPLRRGFGRRQEQSSWASPGAREPEASGEAERKPFKCGIFALSHLPVCDQGRASLGIS